MYTVAVIGGGVIGVTTAIAIQKRLHSLVSVTIFTEELSPNTTGDVSAGLWTPYLLQGTPQDKVIKWSKDTFDYCVKLWKEGAAEENGITLQPSLYLTTNKPYMPPVWASIALGYQNLNEEQLKRISKEYKRQYTGGCHYLACTWEPSIFLPKLQEEFIANGGRIRIEKIDDVHSLMNYDVIVNCAGLNAKELMGDGTMIPIRGQVARVKAPMQFYAFMDDSDDGCYIISNINHVVLGGTHQEGDYNLKVNESDKNFILSSCYEIIPALKTQPVIKHMVGLRPGRNKVRLESELIKKGERVLNIVHNYGHGGSGVTLSIGCAKETAKLVENVLNVTKKSKL